MAHFAEVIDGVVVRVIAAEQAFINSGAVGDPARWVQTSYNTINGVHKTGGTPFRKNFAGIGYTYDEERDAFIQPMPDNAIGLDEAICQWIVPQNISVIVPGGAGDSSAVLV